MDNFVFNKSDKHIVVAGHRGAKSLYPENTMLSYQKAIEMGCDQLEIDLKLTRDGKLILMHDDRVDRTTNCTGLVANFTLAEIKQMDAGSHLSPEFAGTRVPEFFELLDFIKNTDVTLNVEIKDKNVYTTDLIMKTLEAYPMKDRFVIACWDANYTEYVYEKYGARTQGFPKEIWSNYRTMGGGYPYAIGIPMDRLTKELCEEYVKMGIQPWCWCPDDEQSVKKAIEAGARLMTCNDPRPALKVLREMGLHD